MNNKKLLDLIIGFQNYDSGATDAGLKDDSLKAECRDIVNARRGSSELMDTFKAYVHELAAPETNYTLEDVGEFLRYLSEEFDYDVWP